MFGLNRIVIGYALLVFSTFSFANNEIPDFYQEPGVNPQREYSVGLNGTEYIDPFTGILRLSYKDIIIPGNGGLDIEIVRTYHTSKQRSDIVGYKPYINGRTTTGLGWDIHFGRVYYDGPLFPNGCEPSSEFSDANPVLELPDGSRKVFFKALNTTDPYVYITKDRWIAECIDESINGRRDGGLLVTSPDGTKYTINFYNSRRGSNTIGEPTEAWHTTKIEDRNGNWISINYKDHSTQYTEINTITSSDNRLVTFTYTGSGLNSSRLTRIESNNQIWNYTYSTVPGVSGDYYFLDRVNGPEGIKWTYTYYTTGTGLFSVKDITGPYGSKTAYNYTQKTANVNVVGSVVTTAIQSKVVSGSGIPTGTWAYAYETPLDDDVTTITTPDGIHKYFHCGEMAIFAYPSAECGQNLGKLLKKEIYNNSSQLVQQEVYTWEPVKISNQKEKYPTRSYFNVDVTADNLVEKFIWRDGRAHTISYSNFDNYGNPKTVLETSGNKERTWSKTYDINVTKWIIRNVKNEYLVDDIVNPGKGVERTYDANGNLLSQKNYGVETKYTYHTTGDIKTIRDPNLNIITYTSYKRGIAQSESHPEAVTITRTVNNTGTVATEKNGNGFTTGYTYDRLNRVTAINTARTDDMNIGISYSWTSRTRTLTRGSFTEVQYYDRAGNLIKNNSGGIETTYTYDPLGRKIFESYPDSVNGVSISYDELNRVVSETNTADNSSRTYSYVSTTPSVVTTEVTNERGKKTTLYYTAYGSPDNKYLKEVHQLEGVTTAINRTKRGDITRVWQGGVERNYSYDNRYYLTQIYNPETGTTYYTYDAAGNKISSKVFNSGVTSYSYDGLNRLETINYPGSTPDVSYVYDKNNNIKSLAKGTGTTQVLRAYGYDPHDNLTNETLSVDSKTFTLDYTYNNIDALSSYTSPSGMLINYAPNTLGWPTAAGPYAFNATYHSNGQLSSFTYGNGKLLSLTQTTRQQLDQLSVGSLINLNYDYDKVGNVTRITDNLNSLNTRNLTYDDIDRLKYAFGNWGTAEYRYNINSDITYNKVGSNVLTYTYINSTRKLFSVSGSEAYNYNYDLYGNVTSNNIDVFSYSDDSNLIDVNNGAINYAYDGNNQRVKAVENNGPVYYVYGNNGKLVYEVGQYGINIKEYIYLGGYLVAQKSECTSGDRDSDQIEDCDEIKLGLNPENSADATEDMDNDGLTNLIEYQIGTSLTDDDSDNDMLTDGFEYTNSLNPLHSDSDCDGISDSYEINNNLNALLDDAQLDKDNDGFNNLREYRAGSDANNSVDRPRRGTIYGYYPVNSLPSPLVIPGTPRFSSVPAIGPDGTVYFASDRLYAFYADGGPVKWAAFVNKETTVNGDEYVSYIDGEDTTVLTCSTTPDSNLEISASIQAGAVTPTNSNQYYSPVIDSAGTVYMGASDGNFYAIYPNGSLKWVKVGNGPISNPALSIDGTLYYGLGMDLYAIDSTDGSVKWVTTIDSENETSVPPLRGLWNEVTNEYDYYLDYGVSPTPSIGLDGTIYILGKSSNLHAVTSQGVQLSEIKPNWPVALPRYNVDTPAELTGSPAISQDGTIYVKSWEGFFNFTLSSIKPNGFLNWTQSIESSDIFTAGDPVLTSDGRVFITAWGLQILNGLTGNIDWENSNYFGGGTSAIDNQGNIYVEYGPKFTTLERDDSIPGVVNYQIISPEISNVNDTWFGTQPVISDSGTLYVAGGEGLYVWNASPEGAHNSSWPMFGGDARRTFDVRTGYDQIAGIDIIEPINDRYFDLGVVITFGATAVDSDLTDISANIEWVSNQDGVIGTGAQIQYSLLSDNYHEITARVTDSQGNVFTSTTNVIVCAYDDLDMDNLPDCYEFVWGLDPTDPADALADLDGDGLSNIDEFNLGTHIANADTDYDHIPDGFEVANGFNPFVIDSESDLNGDGNSNLQEYLASILQTNLYPALNILEPIDGAEFNEGSITTLSATAIDAEDGDLSSNITWSSSIDGALGTGAALNVTLSVGAHIITASTTDNGTVNDPPFTSTVDITIQINQSATVPGDINGDSKLGVADVILAKQHLLGSIQLSNPQIISGDLYPVGGDGQITLSDVLIMQQQLLQTGTQP